MKKTLIALMALAGVACAVDVWTLDPTAASTGTVTTAPITIQIDGFTQTPLTTTAISYVDGSYQTVATPSGYDFAVGTNAASNSFTLLTYVNFSGTYPTGHANESFFFGTGSDDKGGIALNIIDGNLSLTQKTIGHNKNEAVAINSNTWYHIALAYDGATNKATLFVNGEAKSTITMDTNNGSQYAAPAGTNMYFGAASPVDAQNDFIGSIAQFQIVHGAALGAADIKAIAIPEPATATLSLLALAGLCARRRRA